MKNVLLAQLNNAYEFFERSTRLLTAEDGDFTPAPGSMSATQQVAHAAQTIDWFMEGAFRPEGFDLDFPSHFKAVQAVASLDDARAWLKRAVENARARIESTSDADWQTPLPDGPVMGGVPRAAILSGITDHTAHHRGALTVYARLLGKTPPMPYADNM